MSKNPKPYPAPVKRLVIDESVSSRQVDAVLRYRPHPESGSVRRRPLAQAAPGVPRLTLVECRKGPILEPLRAKLATLPRDSNEPVDGDLDAIRRRLVPLLSDSSNEC